MTQDYIINSIIPYNCGLTPLHMTMLGCPCQILELEVGKRCLFRCALNGLPDGEPPHRISTSPVTDVEELHGGARLMIRTENTTYILDAIEKGDDAV